MSLFQELKHAYDEIFEINPLNTQTWLAIGAVLQLLSFAFLPPRISTLLPILYLIYRVINAFIDSRRASAGTYTTIKRGRWTAELPKPEDPSENHGIVMFVLGARINHPLGPLAPGMEELGKVYEGMWREAETNREKWGFLGKTSPLVDSSDPECKTMIWLSYWKDLKGLQEYATCAAHRLGEVGYNSKKYPYVGIMHETYHAPKGCWETIYDNMPPWGLGKIGEGLQTFRPKSSGVEHSSMFQRMRKNAQG